MRRTTRPTGPPLLEPWPKEMAVRRLKEAHDQIAGLEHLNHRDEKFTAWLENVRRVLDHNWPHERLPTFSVSRLRMHGEPIPSYRDIEEYKRGLSTARTRLELILRNEEELAEAQGNQTIREIFLPPGSQHTAYQRVRDVISGAKTDLVMIDNYVDGTLFQLLTNVPTGLSIRVLTFNMKPDFVHEGRKFLAQYRINLEVRQKQGDFHDRFIIIDSVQAYHLGASIKDLGTTAAMINLIEDPDNVSALLATQLKSWPSAQPIPL